MSIKKLYHHQPAQLTNHFYLKVYVSFDDWKYIPRERFEWIEEWHAEDDRKYLVGVLHAEQLIGQDWWKQDRLSLILKPDAIIEDIEIRNLKKKSLELAGVL